MYERPRVNVKVERGSTFTFTRDLSQGGFPLSRNFYLRTYVNFTRVNKIEATYGGSRVNVKVRSSFTFARGLSYIASISFTRVNFTCIRTEKLRESGNELRHCLYSIYARIIYVRTHGKITRQWKSTFSSVY